MKRIPIKADFSNIEESYLRLMRQELQVECSGLLGPVVMW